MKGDAYIVLVGRPEGKGRLGRAKRRRKKVWCGYLAQDREKRAVYCGGDLGFLKLRKFLH
jgi:hypothetical protein